MCNKQSLTGKNGDMATETVNGRRIVAHGKDRDFTFDEVWELYERVCDAEERGDDEEVDRLLAQTPISPQTAAGVKRVFGDYGVELLKGFDLTEANLAFGEGWIDE